MSFLSSSLAASLKDWVLVLLGAGGGLVLLANALSRRSPPPSAAPKKRKGKEKEAASSSAAPSSSSSDEASEEGEEEEETKPVTVADLAATARAAYERLGPRQQLGARVGAGLLAVGLAYLFLSWLLSGGATPVAAPVDGLQAMTSWPSEAWYRRVRFYTLALFITREGKQIPYVACQHYAEAERIHSALLGPKAPSTVTDTTTEHAIDTSRARGLKRCVLEAEATLGVDDSANAHDLHMKRPMPWELVPPPSAEWLDDAPVRYMFLTRRGERYYRVVAIRASGAKAALEPLVVSESELLSAAHEWYHQMIMEARDREWLQDRPCLCDAHFGIYASGLAFFYDPKTHEWSLRLDVAIARPLTKFNETEPMKYKSNFKFPNVVDTRLRRTTGLEMDPAYHGRNEIEYINPAAVAAEAERRLMFQGLDAPNDELGLAGVVDMAALGLVPEKTQVVDTQNDCVFYCLALTAAIQKRVAPAAVATTAPAQAEL
jgi:hypothetical protein